MKVAFFGTKRYDRAFFEAANARYDHDLHFFEPHLTNQTVPLAAGHECICVFVNDQLSSEIITRLADEGTRLIALRCAGFNNVDLAAAARNDVTVARVPAYSPYAVAEHTIGLMLTLNRKLHRGYTRAREGNFSLEGLLGFDMHGKTVGIVGTGKIGAIVARILEGFGCTLVAYDVVRNPECETRGVTYIGLPELFACSDIVTLHCPLTPETHHLINAKALALMKDAVMLINTSRGALVDTQAVINALKSGKVGCFGLDVYEEEGDLFFEDLSDQVIQDDVFARLLTFPNVVITGHQAFFTRDALTNIAETTLSNITCFEQRRKSGNEITTEFIRG